MYLPSLFIVGEKLDKVMQFTLLLGVLLSDVPDAMCGNFMVWPGSHIGNGETFVKMVMIRGR
tara:strand:- start:497 stop:682 length:186 start_codon:yes stop_codon:yes gene_type:complete